MATKVFVGVVHQKDAAALYGPFQSLSEAFGFFGGMFSSEHMWQGVRLEIQMLEEGEVPNLWANLLEVM